MAKCTVHFCSINSNLIYKFHFWKLAWIFSFSALLYWASLYYFTNDKQTHNLEVVLEQFLFKPCLNCHLLLEYVSDIRISDAFILTSVLMMSQSLRWGSEKFLGNRSQEFPNGFAIGQNPTKHHIRTSSQNFLIPAPKIWTIYKISS
jgi:hypothetical protein